MVEGTRETLTRDAVVSAARAMIERDGLDAVSLRRLAAKLGVTAPALYAYVADKGDLLRTVAEEAFAELTGRFQQIDDDDPLERLRAYSQVYVGFAVEQPELFRTMFLFPPELGVSEPTGAELPAATRAFDVPLQAIADAMAAGLLREQDPLLVALTLWTATHGVADVVLMGFGFDDAGRDELVATVLDTILRGLRS